MIIRKFQSKDPIPWLLLLDADPSRDMVMSYLNESEMFLVELDGLTVGVLVLVKIDVHRCEIKNVSVDVSRRGEGIASKLISYAEDFARDSGFTDILIGTGNSSLNQLSLYQHLGYELFEIRKNYFIDHYEQILIEKGIQCKHMLMLEKKLN